MARRTILVSWVGHTDLRAMAPTLAAKKQSDLKPIVGNFTVPKGQMGPVKTLLEHHAFDEVHLLSDYPTWANKEYLVWLGHKAKIHKATLRNPTDYGEIYGVVDAVMKTIAAAVVAEPASLAILLSPGTPAMAAVWVLLGKSKYPAKFYQTFEGKAWETDIPFDLAVDVIPEMLRGADSVFQHLASKSPQEVEGFEDIVGDSKAIRLAVGRARKAAFRDVSVLLLGESGAGKEMFASAIHAASRRKDGPFIPINCAAIPKELLESELFGHVKGAFTGAEKARKGAFALADGGILFLDEIGECDPAVQAKLLRVLQPVPSAGPCVRKFSPVGSADHILSDVRVIAATNRNLIAAVEEGFFREDLYYRLAVISIKLPPLRERKSDIPKLATALLGGINRDFATQEPGYEHKTLSGAANVFVNRYPWPGNVRQLSNALLQAAVMSDRKELRREDIEAALFDVPGDKRDDPLDVPLGEGFSLDEHLQSIHRHFLKRAMTQSNGVKSQAARLLGIKNYQTLDAQLKRLAVDWRAE